MGHTLARVAPATRGASQPQHEGQSENERPQVFAHLRPRLKGYCRECIRTTPEKPFNRGEALCPISDGGPAVSMHLPFLQLEADFIRVKAPMIAAFLRQDRRLVIGMGADLFAFIITETSTEEKPPDGILADPDAASVLEAVMGWTGEPGKCLDAFVRAKVVEPLTVGVRVKGTERYRKAWEKAAKARSRKAAWRAAQDKKRKSQETSPGQDAGQPEDVPRNKKETHTHTHTQKEKETHASPTEKQSSGAAIAPQGAAAAPHKLPPGPLVRWEKPTMPRESWGFTQWQQWAQATRQEAGLPPEDPLPIHDGEVWWAQVTEFTGGAVQPICSAFIAFGKNPFWQEQNLPLRGFMKQWRQFIAPKEAPRAARRL